ncbi:MAG: DeoR/GlpR family DNA-binding transcription regulator [Eubacteriales bacterium]|nr:DeoR/GlpR family DNA-binding transcription regulator [Eubacteriales bacterium]
MILNDRQSEIIEFLKTEKRASVKKLAGRFFVSEMTIRRDLKELEREGFLQRYNGGAVYSADYDRLPMETRKLLHAEQKKLLSEKTRNYLHDDISVYIDSSSTCLYVIPLLSEYKGVKLITNSVQCLLLASKYHIPCVMAGGDWYEHDMCTVGGETDSFLRRINTDVGFFSALAISDDGVISDEDSMQTSARRAAMENCQKIIFMLDSTKAHKKYTYTIARIEDVDEILIV